MEDRRKVLYDRLHKEYDLGDFESFSEGLNDENVRKNFYDVVSERYDIGDYDTFVSEITPKDTVANQVNKPYTHEYDENMNLVGGTAYKESEPYQYKPEVQQHILQNKPEMFKSNKGSLLDKPLKLSEEQPEPMYQPQSIYNTLNDAYGAANDYAERVNARAGIAERNLKDPIVQKGRTEADMRGLLTEIDGLLEKEHGRLKSKTPVGRNALNALMGSTQYNQSNKGTQKNVSNLDAAKRLLEQSQYIVDAAKRGDTGILNDTWQGFKDSLEAEDFTFGLADVASSAAILDAIKKVEKGEELTESEDKLLRASAINMAVQYNFANDLGRAYKMGQVTAESVPFMLEMAINPISSFGKASAKTLLNYGLKSFAKQVGKGLAKGAAAGAGMAMTTGLGGVAAGTTDRLAGNYNYGVDFDGKLYAEKKRDAMGVGEALARSFATRAIENQSEMIFRAFDGLGDFMKGVNVSLPGGVNKFFDLLKNNKAADAYRAIKNSKVFRNYLVKDFRNATQIGGYVEEAAEEAYNNLANFAIGEMSWDELTDLDNNIDMLLGLAPTQVMFGLLGLGGAGAMRYQTRRTLEDLQATMNEQQRKELEGLLDMGLDAREVDVRGFIRNVMQNENYTIDNKRDMIKAAFYVAKQKGIDQLTEADVIDKVNAENAEIDAATDPQTGLYGEVTMIDHDENGEQIDVTVNVYGEKVVNGKLYLLVEKDGEKVYIRPMQYYSETYQKRPAEEVKALNEEMIREEAAVQAEQESKYAPEVLNAQMQQGVPFNTPNTQIIPISPLPEGNGWIVEEYPLDTNNKVAKQPIVRELTTDEYRDMLQAQLDAQGMAAQQVAEEETATPGESVGEQVNSGVNAEVNNPTTNVVQSETAPQGAVEGNTAQETDESGTSVEEVKQPTLEDVVATLPKNKKGEIDYKAMTPQQQYQYTSLSESPEVALEDLQADITANEEEIAKVQEQLGKARGGERAELRDKVRNLTSANEELKAFYESVAPKQEIPVTETESIEPVNNEAQKAAEEVKPIVVETEKPKKVKKPKLVGKKKKKDSEFTDEELRPANGVELAAEQFAAGNVKITIDSYKKETGHGEEERKKMGLTPFRGVDKGGLTIEQAAEKLVEEDNANHNGRIFGGDTMAARDAIIELFGSTEKWGDVTGYIKNIRMAERKKREEAEYAEYEAYLMESLHVTPEELELLNEAEEQRIYELSKVIDEVDAIFAEAELERQNNEVYEQGRIIEGNQGQSELLSEKRVGDLGGNQRDESQRGTSEVGGTSEYNSQTPQESASGSEVAPSIEATNVGRMADIEARILEIEGRRNEISDEIAETPDYDTLAIAELRAEEWELDQEQAELEAEYSGLSSMNDESRAIIEAEGGEVLFRSKGKRTGTPKDDFVKRAEEWSEKTGVMVRFANRLSDVSNREARQQLLRGEKITGWYEKSTGEVVLYLPNLSSMEEVDATYIHEVVAHKGMSGLLGDRFNEFLDSVWNMMSLADKRKYWDYPGVSSEKNEEDRRRAAADEYIANTFESIDVTESVWSKLTDLVKRFLKAIGIEPKMTNADIANTIKKSYQRLLSGEGAEGNVSGEGVRFNISEGVKPSLLDVVRTLYAKGKAYASQIFQRSFFDVANTPQFMKDLGLRGDKFTVKYGVIARHFGKDGSHDLTEEDWSKLPESLQNPFAISKIKNEDDAYRIYTALKTSLGEYVVVGVDVKNAGRYIEVNAISTVFGRRSNANLPQNEEVIYRSPKITPEQTSLLEQPNSVQYPSIQENISSDNKDNTSDSEKQEKPSLFRVVYHGSGADFDKFDHSFMGTGEGNQSFGWGTYVTDSQGIGKQYAKVIGGEPVFTYKGMSKNEAYKMYPELQYLAFFMDRGDSAEEAIERRKSILNKVINTEGVDWFRKEMAEKSLEVLDSLDSSEMKMTKNRHLYEVEIPDNNGTNYLTWEEPLTEEQKERIKAALTKTDEYKSYAERYGKELSEERVDTWLSAKGGAGRVYRFLENFFEDSDNSSKAVSELFSDAGFVGMEYPANYYGGGNSYGDNNYVIFNEDDLEIVEHTRFRVTKDKNELVAVHNISEDDLRKVLNVGGLIMPSIAITKADMGHEGYGEISLLFGKETINPSDKRNKVYGGDAWTPRFPQMTPKLNDKVSLKVYKKIKELISDRILSENYSLSAELHSDNIERTISDRGIEGYYDKEWMKLAYLLDRGKKVKVPMKTKDYGNMSETIIEMAKERGLKVSDIQQSSFDFYQNNSDFVDAVKKVVDEKKLSSFPEEKREALRKLLGENEMRFNYFDTLISAATRMEYDLEHGGLKQIIDRSALSETIKKKVKTENADYNKWVDSLFDGIVEKYGIRNDRDWYTPSGNLRPWGQLYDEATPANILKHMLAENEQGGSGGFFDSNIMGASAETYDSIEKIREKGKKRLRRLEDGEYEEWSNSVAERMSEICYGFLSAKQKDDFGASIDAKIAITNAVAKDKTAKGIYKEMKREYPGFTMEHAKKVEEIVKEIQDFAIGYFEAKPRRIVPLREVRKAIVPKKTSEDILEGLKNNGIEVATYKRGDEAARARLIKRESNGIRFRVSNRNQEIFVSNAQRAVEGIKQEKATPQQWLAMIEKNGGLKAGEDKWLGLSDWLKDSTAKTLTKAEILDFINQNKIRIEEVKYSGEEDDIQTIGNGLADSRGIEFRDEFMDAFGLDYGEFYIADEEAAIELYNKNNDNQLELDEYGYLDERDEETLIDWAKDVVDESTSNPINSTRLNYTTEGLENKQEIALTVPTIEPWNVDDEIHFGDAGEGRAVAWVRFGETTTPNVAFINAREAVNNYIAEMREKYNVKGGDIYDVMNEEEVKHLQELTSAEFDTRDKVERVLVIDEIQSKRHQEGRERGYKNPRIEELRKLINKNEKERNKIVPSVMSIYKANKKIGLNGAKKRHEELVANLPKELNEKYRKLKDRMFEYTDEFHKVIREKAGDVPTAPFEKNWSELAFKRMLRYAAENGFDKVAWTKGEQQAERYNIGGTVSSIDYFLRGDGTYRVETYGNNGYQIESVPTEYKDGQALAEVFGKELATKMVKDLEEDRTMVEDAKKAKKEIREKMRGMDDNSAEYETLLEEFSKYDSIQSKADEGHSISGDGLRVGGEGMKGFYDKMLPSFVNKYVKKWGTKVQDVELPNVEEAGRFMHSVDVTDAMKESVMEGQTMFRVTKEKMDALNKEVTDFTSEYKSKPVSIVEIGMDDKALLEAFGNKPKLEDLKSFMERSKTSAAYIQGLDKIVIFADNASPSKMKLHLFHENIHGVLFNENHSKLIAEFYEYGKDKAELVKWIEALNNEEYEKYSVPEEFLAYVVSDGMVKDDLENVFGFLSDRMKKDLDGVLKKIGYDYDNRRRNVGQASRPETEGKSGVEDDADAEGKAGGNREGTGKGKSGKISQREQAERLGKLFGQVADMGLNGVLGNGHYDKAMMDIYRELPEDARRIVSDDALGRPKVDFIGAMSDYLNNAEISIWDKVTGIIRDALRKVGFDVELNTNDVKYILWRNRKPLDRNNLVEVAEDIDMRYRLKVGEYSGSPTDGGDTPGGGGTRFRVDVGNKLNIRDQYEATIKKGGYQAREAVQDSMLSLRRAQELIEKATGKKLRDFENAWMHENRLSSVVQSAIHEMERKFYKPMTEVVKKLMKAAGLEQEQVADYLMLKHAIERNREMAVRKALTDNEGKIDRDKLNDWYEEKRRIRNDANLDTWRKKQEAMDDAALMFGADMSRDYSGLTSMFDTDDLADCTERAYDEVETLENDHPNETEALGKAIKAMTQNTLDESFGSGLMNKAVYDELSNDMYDYYIPLRGFEETTSDEVYAYMDNDRGAFNAPLVRAKGRSSKADNPLAYLKSIAESGIMQGERNKMKQTFLNMVINHPSDLVSVREGVWAVYNPATGEWEAASFPESRIPRNATPADVEAAYEQWEADMEQQAQTDPNVKKISEAADVPYRVIGNRMNQHQVIVKRLGKSYTLTINGNPRLAMALNGLTNPNNTSNDGKVSAFVQNKVDMINRNLSAWYTTRNPDFVASNFMRDTFYTNTIVRAKEGNHYANHFHAHYAKLLMPGRMFDLFRKYENGTLDLSKPMERDFHEFMMNGGETGYSNLKDLEHIKKQIAKDVKGGRLEDVKGLLEKLDLVNRAVENTARFAAYRTSRQQGRSVARAIFDAKEISVNFNKKGAGGTFFGATGQTGFGNLAAMVGAGGRAMYVFFNAAIQGTTNILHVTKKNPVGAGAGLAAMFLMGAVLPMLLGGDDEKDYYDLPEHVRRNHLILPGVGDAWISIPLPIEYRIMYGMGELLTSWRTGHERGSDIGRKMLSLTGQALPLNFLEEGVDAFVPSSLSPLWQVYNNQSWTGLPIYKDNEFNKDNPEYTKAYKNVNRGLYKFTKALYNWTFDEENQEEGIDLNPAVIEHVAKGYFGGLVTTLDNVWKTGEMVLSDREFDWRNIPIGNRIFKSGDERTKEKRIQNEYFENVDKLEFMQSRERLLRKTKDGAGVPEADKLEANEDYRIMLGSSVYKKYIIGSDSFKAKKKAADRIYRQRKEKDSDELEKKYYKALEEANKAVR